MGKKYKHVRFVEHSKVTARTRLWWAWGKGDLALGCVKWYSPWRRYCFYPENNLLFDASCLWDIADFISSKTTEEQELQKKRREAGKEGA